MWYIIIKISNTFLNLSENLPKIVLPKTCQNFFLKHSATEAGVTAKVKEIKTAITQVLFWKLSYSVLFLGILKQIFNLSRLLLAV